MKLTIDLPGDSLDRYAAGFCARYDYAPADAADALRWMTEKLTRDLMTITLQSEAERARKTVTENAADPLVDALKKPIPAKAKPVVSS